MQFAIRAARRLIDSALHRMVRIDRFLERLERTAEPLALNPAPSSSVQGVTLADLLEAKGVKVVRRARQQQEISV